MPETRKGDLPAFPTENDRQYWHGMSLRDWFAGQALAGICSDGNAIRRLSGSMELTGPQIAAEAAYAAADAMLAARSEKAR